MGSVNHLCLPSDACQQCVREINADTMESQNRLWCKCASTLAMLQRYAQPTALMLAILHGLVALAAARRLCMSEAVAESPPALECEPLVHSSMPKQTGTW